MRIDEPCADRCVGIGAVRFDRHELYQCFGVMSLGSRWCIGACVCWFVGRLVGWPHGGLPMELSLVCQYLRPCLKVRPMHQGLTHTLHVAMGKLSGFVRRARGRHCSTYVMGSLGVGL